MNRPQWAARLALVTTLAATGVGLIGAPAFADPAQDPPSEGNVVNAGIEETFDAPNTDEAAF
jgi:hypothetical protein